MILEHAQQEQSSDRLAGELRKGLIPLAVLAALRSPAYGYSLQQFMVTKGFPVDQGTLYPLLRRLDEQGLLQSDWNTDEARPRKYYRLSVAGANVLEKLEAHWGELVQVMSGLLRKEGVAK